MAVAGEEDLHAPIAVARIPRGQRRHVLNHPGIVDRPPALIAERRPRNREQRAGPPRRETALSAISHLFAADRHAHQFFAATSFITSISKSRSATSFFSRPFSISSCRRRRTSSDRNAPNRLRHV